MKWSNVNDFPNQFSFFSICVMKNYQNKMLTPSKEVLNSSDYQKQKNKNNSIFSNPVALFSLGSAWVSFAPF